MARFRICVAYFVAHLIYDLLPLLLLLPLATYCKPSHCITNCNCKWKWKCNSRCLPGESWLVDGPAATHRLSLIMSRNRRSRANWNATCHMCARVVGNSVQRWLFPGLGSNSIRGPARAALNSSTWEVSTAMRTNTVHFADWEEFFKSQIL